ncbi:MAG: sugar ABC transporter ATP-binding protein [Planctomycetota bacterium]
MAATSDKPPLVRMSGVDKRFGSVQVLYGVGLEIFAGEVHILAGENGAGKSTLIKILAGVHTDFKGTIEIDERTVRPDSPLAANALGVAVIYQELSLVPSMSVADNIFLGRPRTTRAGLIDDKSQAAEARRLLGQLGVELDVEQPVEQLTIGTQQLIEIVKALSYDAKVLVMDEPTSALSAPEVERLFSLVGQLKARGCGIVYITHKMEEIERIADRITVLRDGRMVGTAAASELPPAKLVRWMVGREVDQHFPLRWGVCADAIPRHRDVPHIGRERSRVEDFVVEGGRGARPLVDGVSLAVRSGEILGIGGLQGSGASQLLWGLFGVYGARGRGRVWLDGQPVRITRPRRAIDRGIAMLTNDRKATGLVLSMSVIGNATLSDLGRLSRAGWRNPSREREATAVLSESLNLRAASLEMDVGELSGGNQQKVALAKWLQTDPQILLLDEPTRGVDVGAKHEVYQLMNEWTSRGIAIILITSEMPELLAMSDRILVMHRGQVTAQLSRDEATADRVLEAAMGQRVEPGLSK